MCYCFQVEGQVSSLLMGVFDGHSGRGCVDVVNRASLEFVAASCLDKDKLKRVLECLTEKELGQVINDNINALKSFTFGNHYLFTIFSLSV